MHIVIFSPSLWLNFSFLISLLNEQKSLIYSFPFPFVFFPPLAASWTISNQSGCIKELSLTFGYESTEKGRENFEVGDAWCLPNLSTRTKTRSSTSSTRGTGVKVPLPDPNTLLALLHTPSPPPKFARWAVACFFPGDCSNDLGPQGAGAVPASAARPLGLPAAAAAAARSPPLSTGPD